MTVGLEIQAGLETVEVNKGLKQIADGVKDVSSELLATQNNLKNFENALKKSTDPKEIDRLKNSITGLKSKLEVLNSTQNNLLGTQNKFVAGSNQASQALINLGRVAQDAPYGFMGIANNLNPLLESFQRLKVATGSTGGALKSLASAFSGPEGIGVAISIVSSLLLAFGDEIVAYFKNISDAEKAQTRLNSAMGDAQASVQGNISRLSALVSIAKDVTKSDSARNQALNTLNKEYELFNGKLTKANINTAESTSLIDRQTQALIRQSKIKGIEGLIGDTYKKLYETQNKALGENLTLWDKTKQYALAAINPMAAASYEFTKGIERRNEALSKGNTEISFYQSELKKLLSIDADEGTMFDPKKVKKRVQAEKTYLDVIKELRGEQLKLQTQFKFEQIDLGELTKQMQDAYKKAIGELGKMNAPQTVIKGIAAELDVKLLKFNIPNEEAIVAPVTLDVTPKLDVAGIKQSANDYFKGLREKYQQEIGVFNDITKQAVTNAFTSFGEGLASIIQGGNVIDTIFGNLFRTFGDAFVQFGKQIVIQSTLMKTITKALGFGQFEKSIGLGLGMIAAGTLMKGIRIGSNAQGTDYWRGGLTMVGERGPELVSLPRGSRVTPNHEMGAIGGGMDFDIRPVTIFRGTELMVYFNKVSKLNNTVG